MHSIKEKLREGFHLKKVNLERYFGRSKGRIKKREENVEFYKIVETKPAQTKMLV